MKFILSQNVKALALAAFAFAVFYTSASAMPASPFPFTVRNADGSTIEVRVHGDETCHVMTSADSKWLVERTSDGYYRTVGRFDAAAFNDRYRAAKTKAFNGGRPEKSASNTFPTLGKQHSLAILVEYPETAQHPEGRRFKIADPRKHFDDMLNAKEYNVDGATGSVHEYFYDSSNGQFDITFDVYGPITLENDLSYYTKLINGENLNAWCMAEEACRAIDAEVDFSLYDRDKDGIIDNVYIFYAGEGGATSDNPADCIWQHAADIETIAGRQFKFDNLCLKHYACSNEYRYVTNDAGDKIMQAEGIGTVCHEFGHVLGLPDFYDVTGGATTTPGQWAIMDTGCHLNDSRTPPYYSAIERMLLGWLEPVVIGTEPKTLSLRNIANNEAYRINTPNDNEYFLLENRRQQGWDAYISGHGMLVWHVNYSPDYWNSNQVNTRPISPGLDIVRADGIFGNATSAGDPFPGTANVTELNDEGYPNMRTQDYKPTNAPISNITEVGGVISFDICKSVSSLGKVDGLKAENITPAGFTASWNVAHPQAGYILNVFTRNGADVEYAGIYHDLAVSSNQVNVKGLNAGARYFFTVKAVAGNVEGETSDEYEVMTPELTFEFTAPEDVVISDITTDAFDAEWSGLADAVDYAVTLFNENTGENRSVDIDFTDGIENLPAGWTTNCNFTMSMGGYYGAAAPSLSMTDDYGRIQSPVLPNTLRGVEFWYRERSGAGDAYIEIDLLSGGEWVSADRIELPGTMDKGVVYRLDANKIPADATAVKIVYRKNGKGSLAVDDIKVEYAGEGIRTPVDGWNNKRLGSAETKTSVRDIKPGTEYYFAVRGIDANGKESLLSQPVKVKTGGGVAVDNPEVKPMEIVIDENGFVTILGCNGAVEIYNLSGQAIGARLPNRGVYIIRANGITQKIVY